MSVDFDHVFSYHSPDLQQTMAYAELRNKAKEFGELIEKLVPSGADCLAAMRLLRESLMTANAGIALGGRLNKTETNI